LIDACESADYQLTADQVSDECQPSIDRDGDGIPIDMSIKGIDQHSTMTAFGTHDSNFQHFSLSLTFNQYQLDTTIKGHKVILVKRSL